VFTAVQWAGAGYLMWLGVQQLRAPVAGLAVGGGGDGREAQATVGQLLRRGWLVNITNPKGTVFLLAVLPQFLNLQQPLWPQYLIMGLTLSFTDLVVMAGYTGLAAALLRSLRSPQHMRWVQRVFGLLFVAAGLALLLVRPVAAATVAAAGT